MKYQNEAAVYPSSFIANFPLPPIAAPHLPLPVLNPTSPSSLTAKARHDFPNFSKVHSSRHVNTKRTPIDVDISHGYVDLVKSSCCRLIRYGEGTVFVINHICCEK